MVKSQKQNIAKPLVNQGNNETPREAVKIGPSTRFETIDERMSPFGGLLGLVKFLDLVKFKEIFDNFYLEPSRKPLLGHYKMVTLLVGLLFIGFNRLWHFLYIRRDPMLCAQFHVETLPYSTTFWRYVRSLGINQGQSLLMVMAALRERVWHLCDINHESIHIDFDPTVFTAFGDQEGARKGHNTTHRGKKGFRPILGFIEETREYVVGKLRVGKTIGGEEFAQMIKSLGKYLPGCVKEVTIRGDSEMMSWKSVEACLMAEYHFIFSNKQCEPPFDNSKWYKPSKNSEVEYNECLYQPTGWDSPCRFVAMRIPLEEELNEKIDVQLPLLESMKYKYRIFVTDLTRRPHNVIKEYDKRADCENLVGEAKYEGIDAVPSKMFVNNYAFFQIVMLSFNIWRSFKMLAGYGQGAEAQEDGQTQTSQVTFEGPEIVANKIRIARLKLLLIASKIATSNNTTKVKYSEHDARTEGLFEFYRKMDRLRQQIRPWLDQARWQCKHLVRLKQINEAHAM
jgi:hypothetical protein